MKRTKKLLLYVLLALSFATAVITISAAIGRLADNKLKKGQNLFGGYGELHSVSRSHDVIYPLFYDDTNIYAVLDERKLCSFDIKSGKAHSICMRPLCRHSDSPDCTLYKLYDSDFLEFFSIDDKFYYYSKKDDVFILNEWDILRNEHNTVYDKIPAFTELTDNSGMEVKIHDSISSLERINDETIMIYAGSQVYLLDNDFILKGQFFCGSGQSFAWTENEIFWIQGVDFCVYEIDTGKICENVLMASADRTMKPSSTNYYGYNNRLYFTFEDKIMSYEHKSGSISEVTDITENNHFSLLDGKIFHYADGNIVCRDIEKGSITTMSDMTDVPTAYTDKYLIQYNSLTIELFDFNGEKVI